MTTINEEGGHSWHRPYQSIDRERAPDARTTTINRSTINRERAPDTRTTTINYQLSIDTT
ncbi:MAG: hypothetical protein ACRC62_26740 [Microcoleus sp.]